LKVIFVYILSICLVLPGILNSASSFNDFTDNDIKIMGKIAREIEIPAGSDYYFKLNSDNLTLDVKNISAYSSGLSEKSKDAIAKSPRWIQRKLTRQFHSIDGEDYAGLILETSKKFVDEIAFTIACSSIGNIPPVDIVRDNVLSLYKNDEWIKYADIVDYDDNQGNYYSTIRYWVLENETIKQLEYPAEIYYWYVVHPEIASENADYVYDNFWRNYLFNHNDLGYPLLKEKLSQINYLWDCESYSQSGQRLWTWSMQNHPTAIEAISYWIGKTVPAQAFGDRPGQPNIIAHEHNGWCGELQKIAVAAQRTALIPSVGIFNMGEDHVWREFFERGWHQNDNWWSDGGGAVDIPDVYAYGWGKDMSALFAWKGDDSNYEVTSTYIHPEDRKTICFQVMDRRLQPIDGVRITVAVWGPHDTTWLKYRLLDNLENIWESIPSILRGRIIQFLYNMIVNIIDKTPNSTNGPIYCIWNYTNINGKCCFELGQNRSYIFIIQYGNLKKPLGFARYNRLRLLKNPRDKTYNIMLPALSPIKKKHTNSNMPSGDIDFKVSFDTMSYQLHESILWIDDKGLYEKNGKIDFFIVDEANFNKYKDGLSFDCYNFISSKKSNISINAKKNDWYIVFRNNARNSNVILNFSFTVEMSTTKDIVQIVSPDTDIFDCPVFNIGEKVVISGIATDDIFLFINEAPYEVNVQNQQWHYEWDTSALKEEYYLIKTKFNNTQDEKLIRLIDVVPPVIKINTPFDGEIVELEMLKIEGYVSDNQGVDKVEVSIDNGDWREVNGSDIWSVDFDISSYSIGEHVILARAFDTVGSISLDEISFILNESGHDWAPIINSFYHKPDHPTNSSNIVIYANITTGNPFNIQRVVLYWDNGVETRGQNMFRYGDFPIQERHPEDLLKNDSNEPIYGLELGEFSNGTNITYWIKAFDTGNNTKVSNKKTLMVV